MTSSNVFSICMAGNVLNQGLMRFDILYKNGFSFSCVVKIANRILLKRYTEYVYQETALRYAIIEAIQI